LIKLPKLTGKEGPEKNLIIWPAGRGVGNGKDKKE